MLSWFCCCVLRFCFVGLLVRVGLALCVCTGSMINMSVGSHKDNYHMLQWCKSTKASHIECWIMLNTVHLVFFEKWQTACPKILIFWHCMCPKAETAKGPAGRMLQRVRRGSRSFHHSFTGHTRDISGPMNAEKQIIRRRQEWHYVTFQSFLFISHIRSPCFPLSHQCRQQVV